MRVLSARFFGPNGRTPSDAEDLVIAQIGSAAEQFSVSRLFDYVESQMEGSTSMAYQVWEESQGSVESSWERQLTAWKRYANIGVKGDPSYKALKPFVEVRNAVMHGLGHLTRRQQRRAADLVPDLETAGVVVDGIRLSLNQDNVLACRDVAVGFIEWLDNRAPN